MTAPKPIARPLSRRAVLSLAAAGAGALLAACAPGNSQRSWRSKESAPMVTAPLILSRDDWGAVPPDHSARAEFGIYDATLNPGGWRAYAEPLADVLTTLVVHHSALPVTDGAAEIQRLHMQARGYADIGYHFLIDAAGQIYAGRDVGVRGAHTGGANTGTVGVALLGNFEGQPPPADQLDALRQLGTYLTATYNLTHLAGHRDFQAGVTVCPGGELAPLLPALAAELGLEFGTAGYVRS